MATLAEVPAHVPADRVTDFDVFAPPSAEDDFLAAWASLRGPTPLSGARHWIAADGALTELMLDRA